MVSGYRIVRAHSTVIVYGSRQVRYDRDLEESAEREEAIEVQDNRLVVYLLNMGSEILIDDECESSFYERRQERWTRVMQ